MVGPKGPTVAAEGCSPPQELEKAARRAAIFLVDLNIDCTRLCVPALAFDLVHGPQYWLCVLQSLALFYYRKSLFYYVLE